MANDSRVRFRRFSMMVKVLFSIELLGIIPISFLYFYKRRWLNLQTISSPPHFQIADFIQLGAGALDVVLQIVDIPVQLLDRLFVPGPA